MKRSEVEFSTEGLTHWCRVWFPISAGCTQRDYYRKLISLPLLGKAGGCIAMGLDWNGLRFLAEARTNGVNFERFITLGRQNQYVSAHHVREIFRSVGLPPGSGGDPNG